MGGHDQNHPQEKEIQKEKWLSEEALQIAEQKSKKAKKKMKDISIRMQRSTYVSTSFHEKPE